MEKGRLVYITISEKLARKFGGLDVSIPLPVELPAEKPEFDPRDLSEEMILSGMLRDLARQPEGKHSEYYRQIIGALKPNLLGELNEAAILKSRNGDHQSALEIFSLLDGLAPDHPLILLNKALVSEAIFPDGEDAGAAWEAALAVAEDSEFPGSVERDILFYAGLFYYRRNKYRRALFCLESFLDMADAVNAEEEPEADDEKKNQAEALLREIRGSGLDDDDFREALDLVNAGREEEGLSRARAFLERYPRAGRGWFLLGWGLRRLGRWENGAACFEKAIEFGCDNGDARNELAICRMELGDYEESRRNLEKALGENPDDVKIISNMGILALKEGKDAEAEAFFRTVLELDPADAIARSFLP